MTNPESSPPDTSGAGVNALMRRMFQCRLAQIEAESQDPLGSHPRLALANLAWMCREANARIDALPVDKLARWLGFVEGCLAMRGLLDPSSIQPPAVAPCPENALIHANRTLFRRYLALIEAQNEKPKGAPPGLALPRLASMCQGTDAKIEDMPSDALSHTLGLVQGCLAMRGIIDVDEEREVSRPLFHAAYAARGALPPTLARKLK